MTFPDGGDDLPHTPGGLRELIHETGLALPLQVRNNHIDVFGRAGCEISEQQACSTNHENAHRLRTRKCLRSDAGDVDGQHRFPEKMPAYDESLHVPLLVHLPGQAASRTSSRLVLNTDLAPTIAQVGLVLPTITMDGRSMVPLFQNPNPYTTAWRNLGLIEHAISDVPSSFTYPPSYLALRTTGAARMFVRYPTITTGLNGELYDLTIDPYQLQNVFLDPARQAEVNRLNAFMVLMRSCKGAGCVRLENSY